MADIKFYFVVGDSLNHSWLRDVLVEEWAALWRGRLLACLPARLGGFLDGWDDETYVIPLKSMNDTFGSTWDLQS